VSAGTVSFRDGRMSQGKLLPERAVSAKGGSAVERYVVRIYRRDPKDPKKIFGTVEWGNGHGLAGFLGSDALVNIMAFPVGTPEERAGSPPKGGTGDEFKSFSEIMESIRVELEGQIF
jgi:hypothetical protein